VKPVSKRDPEAGFSLAELLISTTILLIISSTVMAGLLQITKSQQTIANRTEMHSGVRSATELLQQEVGQAGRVALPGNPVTLSAAVAAGAATVGVTQTINGAAAAASVAGIFVGEQLAIDSGDNSTVPVEETVTVSAVSTAGNTITATFKNAHAAGAAINVLGGFATGIVPPSPSYTNGTYTGTYTNGSTGTVLKLYGDINGDGSMVYVEYTCDTTVVPGNLYRNVMAFDAASKPSLTNRSDLILLGNIRTNPGGTACFTYLPNPPPIVGANTYVLDVAITLTVQTQLKDPITNQFQTETKALLNVSPRNVFNVWQLASAGGILVNRVQPIPPKTALLLP
jgi:Tfp pilus assembly protein PilW